jgi:O-acetyl-ADP-ribose deacetylase
MRTECNHDPAQTVTLGEIRYRLSHDASRQGDTSRGKLRAMGQLSVVLGDLTQQHVDAIVNAANSRMRGGGGVDGAIHRAGGSDVLEDCIRRFPNGLPTGQAGWTTAGRLPARWIIHVVGPNYNAGQRDPELLASCYREALRIADELGARSIAFPAVSAGIYGWPLESAAEIAVNTVASTPHAVADVRFVLLFQDVFDAFAAALAARGNS